MAQKGDSFKSAKFGAATPFDSATTQLIPSFSAESYQGRILRYWSDALGSTPDASLITGLKISGLGSPGLAPAPGTANASLFAYIKQIEIGMAGVKFDTAALNVRLDSLAASVVAIEAAVGAIAAGVTSIENSTASIENSATSIATATAAISSAVAAIAASSAATATSTAAIGLAMGALTAQQVTIIGLLTSIDNKTV